MGRIFTESKESLSLGHFKWLAQNSQFASSGESVSLYDGCSRSATSVHYCGVLYVHREGNDYLVGLDFIYVLSIEFCLTPAERRLAYAWNWWLLVLDSGTKQILESKVLASLVWAGASASSSETAELDRQYTLTLKDFIWREQLHNVSGSWYRANCANCRRISVCSYHCDQPRSMAEYSEQQRSVWRVPASA